MTNIYVCGWPYYVAEISNLNVWNYRGSKKDIQKIKCQFLTIGHPSHLNGIIVNNFEGSRWENDAKPYADWITLTNDNLHLADMPMVEGMLIYVTQREMGIGENALREHIEEGDNLTYIQATTTGVREGGKIEYFREHNYTKTTSPKEMPIQYYNAWTHNQKRRDTKGYVVTVKDVLADFGLLENLRHQKAIKKNTSIYVRKIGKANTIRTLNYASGWNLD
jgi:hypothetical protein